MTYRQFRDLPQEGKKRLLLLVLAAQRGDFEQVQRELNHCAAAMLRARRKPVLDAVADARRRTLVGARLPREQVEQIRQAAEISGCSLYRFTADAVLSQTEKVLRRAGGCDTM